MANCLSCTKGNLKIHSHDNGKNYTQCDNCGGFLVTPEEFREIVNDRRVKDKKPRHKLDSQSSLDCVVCEGEMFPYIYDGQSDVWLRSCEDCNSIWLDAGHLEAVRDYKRDMYKYDKKVSGIQEKLMEEKLRVERMLESKKKEGMNLVSKKK